MIFAHEYWQLGNSSKTDALGDGGFAGADGRKNVQVVGNFCPADAHDAGRSGPSDGKTCPTDAHDAGCSGLS